MMSTHNFAWLSGHGLSDLLPWAIGSLLAAVTMTASVSAETPDYQSYNLLLTGTLPNSVVTRVRVAGPDLKEPVDVVIPTPNGALQNGISIPIGKERIVSFQASNADDKVIYEGFYKVYNKKAADRLGVVYTPNEIVKFMVESADWLCQKHFGKALIDKGVEILDPASDPTAPQEPNRLQWAAMGTGMGLMLGVVMAGAKEMKNTSLKNLKDVRAYTNLPVLSSIPLLENGLLIRRKRRLLWLAWSSATIIGVVIMSTSVYYYYVWGK